MKSSEQVAVHWLAILFFPFMLHASEQPFSSDGKYMTGDWGGLRTDLKKKGL
ncbi:TPA: hypothetical protein OTT96_004497 [Enterobacter hormaechei]|nr:hypothetical protein [Enterobacter hormaechei]